MEKNLFLASLEKNKTAAKTLSRINNQDLLIEDLEEPSLSTTVTTLKAKIQVVSI